ncbi:MAG: glycoside hydrolase [Bifidobacteriaceae bacterium]|jgi:photosystem II stability/assembly factor-like uncharacterized protein|nr:glycoside hydrolase [Bifidobacteriaceae bacterium]
MHKSKKIGLLGFIFFFTIISFLNGLISGNASVSQTVLGLAKGGTNANSVESAQINLGRSDTIDSYSTDNQFPSSKAVYEYIQNSLEIKCIVPRTNGLIAVSKDCVNWTNFDTDAGKLLLYPIQAKGTWVIAGKQKALIYSKDNGKTWTQANLPNSVSNSEFTPLAYGGGRFVTGDVGTGLILYSNDGINWQTASQISNGFIYGVLYVNNRFVAVGQNYVGYSPDGVNWTAGTGDTPYGCRYVVFAENKFMAVCDSYTLSSNNGINWTKSSIPISSGHGIAYGNGKFVITGTNSKTIVYSTNGGSSWTNATVNANANNMYHVQFVKDRFIATGQGAEISAVYSLDGINWFNLSDLSNAINGEATTGTWYN